MGMIRAIIMGAPGSGKGTISGMMVRAFGVKHISSGDLLRFSIHNSGLSGMQAAMKRGELVSDNTVEKIVFPELKKCSHWLLDGFPRTLEQARSLIKDQAVDMMINLNVPDHIIIERLHGRWIHIASGRIYNTAYNPPKVKGIDDETGEPLQQREDDHPEIVQQRLKVYHDQTDPVLDYFRNLGLLKDYAGTESRVMWPVIKKDIQNFLDNNY